MVSNINVNVYKPLSLIIDGVYTGHSWTIILQQFEDDDVTPRSFTGSYTMTIWNDEKRKIKLLDKTLTSNGNELEIGQTVDENILKAKTYYLDVNDDLDAETSYPFIRATLTVTESR